MLWPLLGLSQTSSDSIVVNDTTLDGRPFYVDLAYVESLDKWMMRTDEVGMHIIREIHANNKKLASENKILKDDIFDCNNQLEIVQAEKAIINEKIDLKDQQLNNALESIDLKDTLNRQLQKKANVGKIMLPVGIVGVTIGIAGILYGVIITQIN